MRPYKFDAAVNAGVFQRLPQPRTQAVVPTVFRLPYSSQAWRDNSYRCQSLLTDLIRGTFPSARENRKSVTPKFFLSIRKAMPG
jgi:hypothetical protein